MTFGNRLKKLMVSKGITQKQLSKELNIAASTLNGYANDKREPDYFTLKNLAEYFHVSTDYLLGISANSIEINIPSDDDTRLLLYYYRSLSPNMKDLLISQAELLYKHEKKNEI